MEKLMVTLFSIISICVGMYMVSMFLPFADKAGVVLGIIAIGAGIVGLTITNIMLGRR